ncbi:MAG TPA: FAD-binding oxidoreductase [Conexibacter sp.]|jgi:alkyldihydroxyacetonephosphate synthase|nr:FAD-binding oxidoreductase [Conexibacter sp.]
MTAPAPRMRWWGWGEDGHDAPLSATAQALLGSELGIAPGHHRHPVALDDVRLSEPALPPRARERLAAIVGAEHVSDDRLARVTHAAGRGYHDLVRLRAGDATSAPDAVLHPGSAEEIAAALQVCAEEQVAVVPFGGGTSVVGGVEPHRGRFPAVVALDLARLDRLLAVDSRSLTATVQAGMTGPALEAALAEHELTLGHFPQSFEFSTVGGWVATRSSGQASTGYGRIDALVLALRVATPSGEIATRAVPASAAGPSLRELLVGSEGALGVITEVTLLVRVRPSVRRYEACSLPRFEAGVDAFRALVQAGAAPDVMRLSDAQETRVSLAMSGGDGLTTRALRGYLRARGHGDGCLAIAGWAGTDEAELRRRRSAAARVLRAHGAVGLGTPVGRAWEHGRFHAPYLRDELLAHGVLVETLETATTWDRLPELHDAVVAAIDGALRSRGTPPIVMAHVSHVYRAGASLYFTLVARQQEGAELEQWHAAKVAASDAILAHGGTITHHHAIGRDHAPWLAGEVGELGIELLRAAKATLDPAGIMNPGTLLDPAPLPGAGASS